MSATRLALLEKSGLVRRSGTPFTIAGVTHTPFEVRKRGLPFFDRGGRIHERDGRPSGVAGRTSFPPLAVSEPGIDRHTAIGTARAATGADALLAPARLRLGWLAHEGRSRLAFEVVLATRAPAADWRVWVDAATGDVLGRVDRLARLDGVGVVFETNPRDSKSPTEQPLRELDPGGSLIGRITAVFDQLAPAAFAPNLHFEFPTVDPRFVQTSVYRGLTETGLLAEQHGFPGIMAPVPAFTGLIDPFTGEALNNAFYVPSIPAFGFGDGDGEVLANLGTDIDVPAHEFGHHVFEVLVEPQIFSFEDPVLAMAEGVADTFSLLVGGDARVGNSVVPGQKSLRNLANDATFPDALDPSPHRTGRVYGGANRDIARKLGNEAFGDLLIASLPFLLPEAEHTDYPEAFLDGDQALTGGVNAALLTQVFQNRGFDELDLPTEFQGELVEGMMEGGSLGDGEFHFYVFSDLPPSASLEFESTGTGDIDLFVFPLNFDEDTPVLAAENFPDPDSDELVRVNDSTDPPVDADDFWFVVVQDFPDGFSSSYDLTATAEPALVDDLTLGGDVVVGSIEDPADEIDWLQFSGTAGDRVRVEVEGKSGTIDPLVAVVTREPFDVLEVDDDSLGGPFGVDALLQGVLLPETGLYAVAVLSAVADFDPDFGTGSYEVGISLCNNVGTDSDGDGAADDCDQDDDDDGFVDANDLDPLDPAICIDVDFDGCNDCASGSFDFFDDGPDEDGDGVCDAGDDDDDNDGCEDGIDPAPLTPSLDDDFDFLGEDCDNCPDVPNPVQEDADDDGQGDACTACSRIEWMEPPLEPPDQNPADGQLQIGNADRAGKTKLRAKGAFRPATVAALDPATTGLQLRFADGLGVLHEVVLPMGLGAGLAPCDPKDVWQEKETQFSYKNRSGALPPGCAPGSAGGLSSIKLKDERLDGGAVAYDVKFKNVTLAGPLARPVRFLQFDLVLGEPPGTGLASAAGLAGECAETVARPGSATMDCKISEKDDVVKKVRCKAR